LSACTDLISAINEVVTPFNFTDLAPSIASLSLPTNTTETPQLTGGGNAVLSAPSSAINGRLFTVRAVVGVSSVSASSPAFTGTLYLGNSTSGTVLASVGYSPVGSGSAFVFYLEAQGVWDSSSGLAVVNCDGALASSSGAFGPSFTNPTQASVAAFSDLQFVLGVRYNNISGNATVAVSEFSLQFD
jgi:hypothetical protein